MTAPGLPGQRKHPRYYTKLRQPMDKNLKVHVNPNFLFIFLLLSQCKRFPIICAQSWYKELIQLWAILFSFFSELNGQTAKNVCPFFPLAVNDRLFTYRMCNGTSHTPLECFRHIPLPISLDIDIRYSSCLQAHETRLVCLLNMECLLEPRIQPYIQFKRR